MTRDEALAGLSAATAHLRGQAARAIGELGTAADLGTIRAALKSETVSYVQYALQDAIKRLSHARAAIETGADEQFDVPPEVRQQIYGKAVEWVTGFLLHEVASPIGLATLSAKRELKEGWETSATRRHLETVHRIFEAIEMLKGAAGVPKPEEFDLATMLADFVEEEVPAAAESISLIGPKPFVIIGDPGLIRIAIGNGIRNAVEAATVTEAAAKPHDVVLNWGETDADYWTSVLDRGPGVTGPTEAAFEIGRTTKPRHSGFGLAIARQAIETLTGLVTLGPARGGGAVYTVRWKR